MWLIRKNITDKEKEFRVLANTNNCANLSLFIVHKHSKLTPDCVLISRAITFLINIYLSRCKMVIFSISHWRTCPLAICGEFLWMAILLNLVKRNNFEDCGILARCFFRSRRGCEWLLQCSDRVQPTRRRQPV